MKNQDSSRSVVSNDDVGFKKIAEALPHLVWTCTSDGWCDYLSPQWLAYTGGEEKEYLGFNWSKVVHPDDRQRLLDDWALSVSMMRVYDVEYRIRRHDGGYRWFRAQGLPLKDDTGNILKWIGTSTDIDNTKSVEQALRDSEARKNEFIATLSHELRNPLAPLRNSLAFLRLVGTGSETTSVIKMMERQVDHLVRLVDDLLEMSRISRGTFELRNEPVEVGSIIGIAVETITPMIREKKHRLSVTNAPEQLWVKGDPVRLAQVLSNLLNNAAKYTEPGGQIQIEAQRYKGAVHINVKDNGIGMEHESIPRIFDIFSRADHPMVLGQSGLGIGLSLARRLVEMHGGTIDARSEGPGKGSELMVRLVLAADQNPTPVATGQVEATISQRRILVVDDNQDAGDSLRVLLQALGADVQVARDGADALQAFPLFEPAVLLLDIGMPGMDGYEVARQIRARFPERRTTIIALTGWGQEEDRRKAIEAGFDSHLVKPVEIGALQKLLSSLESK